MLCLLPTAGGDVAAGLLGLLGAVLELLEVFELFGVFGVVVVELPPDDTIELESDIGCVDACGIETNSDKISELLKTIFGLNNPYQRYLWARLTRGLHVARMIRGDERSCFFICWRWRSDSGRSWLCAVEKKLLKPM